MRRKAILLASAGPEVGLGHLTRCRNLAAVRAGAEVIALPPNGAAPSVPSDACVILDTLHSGNRAQTNDLMEKYQADGSVVTIIDSMPPDHFQSRASSGRSPDWIVTPYLQAKALRPEPEGGTWLVGADFAILPPEFLEARRSNRLGSADRVLVTCGGSDPTGLSLRIAKAMASSRVPIDIIVGPYFRDNLTAQLRAFAQTYPLFTLHMAPTSILSLYLSARMVVGRPGLVRYEAAALGRPSVFLSESNNYRAYFEGFAEADLSEFFFAQDAAGADAFFSRLTEIVQTGAEAMPPFPNTAALAIIDGMGAKRIWDALDASKT